MLPIRKADETNLLICELQGVDNNLNILKKHEQSCRSRNVTLREEIWSANDKD